MKTILKKKMMANKRLWTFYRSIRLRLKHVFMLRFYLYDVSNTYKYMYWPLLKNKKIENIRAEILFQFHKLEKGLIMPGKRRLFGEEIVLRLIDLLNNWHKIGGKKSDFVYFGALEALQAYKSKIIEDGFEKKSAVMSVLERFLEGVDKHYDKGCYKTPVMLSNTYTGGFDVFKSLVDFRRSVREYEENKVELLLIEKAVSLAQMSPSVCNRQASKVYFLQDREKINLLLSFQNGNAGFGDKIPSLAIITVDQRCFFNATERNQPYIDGGLFTMSFLYGLSAQGLSSCCLNWCATPNVDKEVHSTFNISTSERIMMLVAIGYPAKDVMVPLSCRKNISDVLTSL